MLQSAEKRKIREYGERINQVEHGNFTPLAFLVSGGMGKQAEMIVKRISGRISHNQDLQYSVVTGWLRTRISFALLRSAIICLRGSRSNKHVKKDVQIDLAVSEARIQY